MWREVFICSLLTTPAWWWLRPKPCPGWCRYEYIQIDGEKWISSPPWLALFMSWQLGATSAITTLPPGLILEGHEGCPEPDSFSSMWLDNIISTCPKLSTDEQFILGRYIHVSYQLLSDWQSLAGDKWKLSSQIQVGSIVLHALRCLQCRAPQE